MKKTLIPTLESLRARIQPLLDLEGKKHPAPPEGYRRLSEEEETYLEKMGNTCENWDIIFVRPAFQPGTIRDCTFQGFCLLDTPREMRNSTIASSLVEGNTRIIETGLIQRSFIGESAEVFMCGRLLGPEASESKTARKEPAQAAFGMGLALPLGSETGGRLTPVTPLSSWEETTRAAMTTVPEEKETWGQECADLEESLSLGLTVVDAESRLFSVPLLRNSFIGRALLLENPALVEDSFLFSDPDHPEEAPRVGASTVIRRSFLQPGTHVDTLAVVEKSLLGEHSGVSRHGKVTGSYIAPNTEIAEGEVTSSLVGPFTGFHHQALLIGALWPQGSGNVAYGANVGSNHTGRLPDQELYGSEGLFFGLGSIIKFPADFSDAPHSLIAAGVTTLPQRVTLPFSLITTPRHRFEGLPPAFNEIRPGWVFKENHYHLRRTAQKRRERNRARYHQFSSEMFTEREAEHLCRRIEELSVPDTSPDKLDVRPFYTEKEIPGLGKNYMTEESRLEGLEAYRTALRWFLLNQSWEDYKGRKETLRKQEYWDGIAGIRHWNLAQRLSGLAELEIELLDWMTSAREKDDRRGEKLRGLDYRQTHPSADQDPFIQKTRDEVKKKRAALQTALRRLEESSQR